MRWGARTMAPVGLGLLLAGVGAAVLRIPESPGTLRAFPASAVGRAEEPAKRITPEDVEALKALTSLKAEVAALKREHDQLTRSLRAIKVTVNRAVSLGVQPGTPSNVEEEAERYAGTDKQLSEEEQITATLDELDLRLNQEPEDPAWSQSTEMEVTAFLHSDGMEGSQVLSVDCRSSLCRVEVAHEDASAQGWLIDHLPMEPPFGEMVIHPVDTDSTAPRTLVYLSRPGQPLLSAIP